MILYFMQRNTKIILCSLLLFCFHIWGLKDGELDYSFNTGAALPGTLRSSLDLTYKAIAIQADGKILVAGFSFVTGKKNCWTVARYLADGTPDSLFGNNGRVVTRFGANETDSAAHAIGIQVDGKIVVGGFTNAVKGISKWCLARYNPDGSLDQQFTGGNSIFLGTVITMFDNPDEMAAVNGLVIQRDEKIVAVGTCGAHPEESYFMIARYNKDGSLDAASFNPTGDVPGTVRTSFGGSSIQKDEANAVTLDMRGKIIVAGSSYVTGSKTFALARYTYHGTLDDNLKPSDDLRPGLTVISFGLGETDSAATSVIVQPDGKIVLGGHTDSNTGSKKVKSRFALARYHHNGLPDVHFGKHGLATVPGTAISSFGAEEKEARVNALVLQRDGKLVAGGYVLLNNESYFAIARYNSDGSVDHSFNGHGLPVGKVITSFTHKSFDEVFGLAIQADGLLVAAGKSEGSARAHGALARYIIEDMVLVAPQLTMPIDGSTIFDKTNITLMGRAQNPGILYLMVNNQMIFINMQANKNSWAYTLSSLVDGGYTVQLLERYQNGNVMLASEESHFTIDRQPHAQNENHTIYNNDALSGSLKAEGASGQYEFSIISSSNGTVTFKDNEYRFVPTISAGSGTITFQVTDKSTGLSDTGSINVAIHDLPHFDEPISCIIYEGNFTEGYLVDSMRGGMGQLVFESVSSGLHGELFINHDSYCKFTPVKGFLGDTSFVFQVKDAYNHVVQETVHVTVVKMPYVKDKEFTYFEENNLTGTLADLISDGIAPYTFGLVNDSATNGTVMVEKSGSFVFEPLSDNSGNGSFQYVVTDANGYFSNMGTVQLIMHKLPVVQDASFTTSKNNAVKGNLNHRVLQAEAAYTFVLIRGSVLRGRVKLMPDGMFMFNPLHNFVGVGGFEYQIQDIHGGISNKGKVAVIINSSLVTLDSKIMTNEETPVQGNLSDKVSGGVPPYIFKQREEVINGKVAVAEDGSFTFTPASGIDTQGHFTYEVTDTLGSKTTGTLVISIQDMPKAQDALFAACQYEQINDSLIAYVTKGQLPYSFEEVEGVKNGMVMVNTDGTFTFVPDIGFTGEASFKYRVVDSAGLMSHTAKVTIKVNKVPIAAGTIVVATENMPLKGTVSNLITDGLTPYTFAAIGDSSNGQVILQEDGLFIFTPASNFVGAASFQFHAVDVHGCTSNIATVTVKVMPGPQPKINRSNFRKNPRRVRGYQF